MSRSEARKVPVCPSTPHFLANVFASAFQPLTARHSCRPCSITIATNLLYLILPIGQIKRELWVSFVAIFVIAAINAPVHLALEQSSYALYLKFDHFNSIPMSLAYWAAGVVIFFIVSDFCIYWIHYALHSNLLYRPVHKLHHSFIFPSPFTAFAFHPLDAWSQSWPYWIMPWIMPMHKLTHLILLVAVTVWTTSIHDRITFTDWQIVNGAGHHYVHHRDFKHNYGQYFTWCDRLFGTYKDPVETEESMKVRLSQESKKTK